MSSALWILTGAPGSGKTAILDQLRGEIRCVDEPARRVLARQRMIDGTGTPERDASRFVELLLELALADHHAAADADGLVLFDRGIPDCIAYANHLGVDPQPAKEMGERYRYHSQVFILEPWQEIYATDPERTMSFEATVSFQALIVDAYTRLGYELIRVPTGAVEDRAAFVRRTVASTGPA